DARPPRVDRSPQAPAAGPGRPSSPPPGPPGPDRSSPGIVRGRLPYPHRRDPRTILRQFVPFPCPLFGMRRRASRPVLAPRDNRRPPPRAAAAGRTSEKLCQGDEIDGLAPDRKSTRLNSSHVAISYAVFCLKKKKQHT